MSNSNNNAQNNAQNNTNAAGQGLEVLLDPRKEVITSNAGQTLDLLVRLRAPLQTGEVKRTPLAISLVIDRSGSMGGRKIAEAKRCALDLLRRLDDEDKVSLVVYDTTIDVLLETMPVRLARTLMPMRLLEIEARGGTALHSGWLKGAETLAPTAGSAMMSRVILLSDGQANEGIVDTQQICDQVRELASAGVTTSTVGIGVDFNEELMTAIANAGQGNSWYGERVEDLAESFDAEMGFLANLAFQDVRVKLDTPLLARMGQIQVRNDYIQNSKGQYCLPSIAAGSEVWMAISLSMNEVIHLQDSNSVLTCTISLKDKQGKEQQCQVKLPAMPVVGLPEYRMATENELVARRFNEVESAEIQREARRHVQNRNWDAVEGLVRQLEDRAHNNPWLQETVKYLRKLLDRRDSGLMEKELMYASNKMMNRVADLNDSMLFCMSEEAVKPAYMRKKVSQGRNTDSQGDVQK
jgi:Ca-activated chloride channel family protein